MDCTNTWLADVHAAGGDLEPPPKPEIPAEYLQKPRRRPAPETYLASPPSCICASFARPKRRRVVLSEIDPPNQKRQRSLNAVAHVMSQRSPTRKSSRQTGTAGKARITTKEAPPVEDVIAAVEHIVLGTQHVIDPNTTPRPTRQKRVAPPALPIPDPHTRPAPILTPSVSEEQAGEDTEAESAHESTTSKRSRSPTRRMVDLKVAKKPVVSKTATSSTDVPQDVKTLYKTIQALARRSKGVIPLGIETEVKQDSNGDLDDLEDYMAKTPNGKTHEELKDEFKGMRDIRNETSACKTKHLHEPSWNELVHSQMLKQAVLGRPGFSYYNITTARVIKELVPGNEYGELLKGKMIDFAVTLGPPLIPTANVINRLTASPRKLQRTCNPSDYSPLCYEPAVLGIETKSPDGGSENGEVQLSVWTMAYFNRLRQLIQDPVSMTLPLLLVVDARWKLYFASDLAHEIHLIDAVDIGTTADIIGCYTILEALRVIFKWVEEIYSPWFLEGLKPE
ncbi:uncharacterized protein BDR25DRAFT_266464 [Lindgomyces ingoldianus]|uniref:Uncharacterized protein n=1 Tax=Lindgomyces ingoldianus TaxID=673940 RepID=A0ACB6QM70_9PLEO|nr:uncharacterized protein BDR25DRAFT_266464 [Lindgomyces ingoldianus]KAF2467996.1 hypothetical protein BDR25DRAFT_266464 [Lindgomyces ingoldianus]